VPATWTASTSSHRVTHARRRTRTTSIPTVFSTLWPLRKWWLWRSHWLIRFGLRPRSHGRRSLRRRLLVGRRTQNLCLGVLIETPQLRYLALGIFTIDFDRTRNEEVLLLGCPGLPVIRLRDGHSESHASCPLPELRLPVTLRWKGATREGLDGGQLLQVPSLANAEAAIVVLPGLVHSNTPCRAHSDDDQARLFGVRWRLGRRWSGRMLGILLDADMSDVGFGELATLVKLGEARLDDTLLLILEALRPRHVGVTAGGIAGIRRSERGVGGVAGVAVSIGRPIGRWSRHAGRMTQMTRSCLSR
jgi:hypothetical protein